MHQLSLPSDGDHDHDESAACYHDGSGTASSVDEPAATDGPVSARAEPAARVSTQRAEPALNTAIASRIDALDWPALEHSLAERGYAVTPAILPPAECEAIVSLYPDESRFRSHIVMERQR